MKNAIFTAALAAITLTAGAAAAESKLVQCAESRAAISTMIHVQDKEPFNGFAAHGHLYKLQGLECDQSVTVEMLLPLLPLIDAETAYDMEFFMSAFMAQVQ